MQIHDLTADKTDWIDQIAAFMPLAFARMTDAWETEAEAREEVLESFAPDRISRVAVDEHGVVLGWIGGIAFYSLVWELHPLVVREEAQGRGVGRALVADLEIQVAARGGMTLFLGTDDEYGLTSLSGKDLYPDPLTHLAAIQNLNQHPFTFYQKCGFTIVGVVPDANGFGAPDILMAKRIGVSAED